MKENTLPLQLKQNNTHTNEQGTARPAGARKDVPKQDFLPSWKK